MGLYDGKNGTDEEGSTAALAKLLDAPVLVVLDIGKISRTAGAWALGMKNFDPALKVAGFLLNNAGGEIHYQWARESVENATGLPVLGWLPGYGEWALPERHLGLIPAGEGGAMQSAELDTLLDKLAAQINQTVQLDKLIQLAGTVATPDHSGTDALFPATPITPKVRLGLAWDEAFNFYYQDNLDLLRAWGAEIVPFSPLNDTKLPEVEGLYLGGGFPEVFATRLSENQAMLQAIKQAGEKSLPIYAECGGLMYLCRELKDFEGQTYPMVGLVPYTTRMQQKRVFIGYTEVTGRGKHPFLPEGETVRGHEFHWSQLETEPDPNHSAYLIKAQKNRAEGWLKGNILASYIHLHFGTEAHLTPRLIEWLKAAQEHS